MQLQHFLTATVGTDDRELRQAMAVALALEIPHNRVGYERFYRSVVDALDGRDNGAVDVARTPGGGRLPTAA